MCFSQSAWFGACNLLIFFSVKNTREPCIYNNPRDLVDLDRTVLLACLALGLHVFEKRLESGTRSCRLVKRVADGRATRVANRSDDDCI